MNYGQILNEMNKILENGEWTPRLNSKMGNVTVILI